MKEGWGKKHGAIFKDMKYGERARNTGVGKKRVSHRAGRSAALSKKKRRTQQGAGNSAGCRQHISYLDFAMFFLMTVGSRIQYM